MKKFVRPKSCHKTQKRCVKCKRTLPISEFYLDPKEEDGLNMSCKACESARGKAYRAMLRSLTPEERAARKRVNNPPPPDSSMLWYEPDGSSHPMTEENIRVAMALREKIKQSRKKKR